MRIVELIPTLSVGGAERVVSLLAVGLQELGHEVEVVVLGAAEDSWIEAELRQAGVPLHFLDKGAGLDLGVVPRLARLLRRLQPDLVHTHLHVLKYLLPGRLLRQPPFAIVHTLHNLAGSEAVSTDLAVQRLVFGRVVVPVAIGEAVAQSVVELYGRPAHTTIANGVPVAAQQAPAGAGARVRRELGLGSEELVLLAVGRLNEQKNHALLIEAFAQASRPGSRLIIAGEGDRRPALEASIRALGLEGRVQLLGVRRDVPALLAASDAFVMSSDWEGNPLVVMEASAAGRAVISTAVGCVPELVQHGITGLLLPPGDLAAMSRTLAEVEAPALRDMGAAGAALALARFDAPVMARAYSRLFRQLVVP